MGKRKKQQEDPWAALFAQLGVAVPNVTFTQQDYPALVDNAVEALRSMSTVGTLRRVDQTRTSCHCPARDAVLVLTGNAKNQERMAQFATDHAVVSPKLRPISIVTINAHGGAEVGMADLDVEDAKKLVNALAEAIAETERITAEV